MSWIAHLIALNLNVAAPRHGGPADSCKLSKDGARPGLQELLALAESTSAMLAVLNCRQLSGPCLQGL